MSAWNYHNNHLFFCHISLKAMVWAAQQYLADFKILLLPKSLTLIAVCAKHELNGLRPGLPWLHTA